MNLIDMTKRNTKPIFLVPLFIFLLTLPYTSLLADQYADTRKMFEDAGIGYMFRDSYGYALFPIIGKGGYVIGGAFGEGRVFEQSRYIGDTTMFQASIGFQLGGLGFSQVIFFQDERALKNFTSGTFEFGAEAQATVITAAAGASANTTGSSATISGGQNNARTTGTFNKGMATFTITRGGLMYEASIGGQKFNYTPR